MDSSVELGDSLRLTDRGTGGENIAQHYREIVYPFDRYEITVQLTDDNEFVGITEVKINKDFLSHKQKTISTGVHDVEEFYRE